MTEKKTRIATVKESGSRYVVQRIDFDADRVYCWGEVTETLERGGRVRMWHAETEVFDLAAVEIAEVKRTGALAADLFEQTLVRRKREGVRYERRGRRNRIETRVGRLPESVVALAVEMGVDLAAAAERDVAALLSLAGEEEALRKYEAAVAEADRELLARAMGELSEWDL